MRLKSDFSKIKVYYIIGLPRSGSTFVADQLAKNLGAINAGEVWQTFRTVSLVSQPNLASNQSRWANPKCAAEKEILIRNNEFWREILNGSKENPYESLCRVVSKRGGVIVDSSKGVSGIKHYSNLGCDVEIFHTIRPYSSWSKSFLKYADKFEQTKLSRFKLFAVYLKMNCCFASVCRSYRGTTVYSYDFPRLEQVLPSSDSANYERHEMFGTESFQGYFSPSRSSDKITVFDRAALFVVKLFQGREV